MRSLLLIIIIAFCYSTNLYSQTKFETPGTYTWVVPPCVNSITVKAWGGGGGGGGTSSKQTNTDEEACTQGGGGGGGGFTTQTYSVTPGESYTIIVGAGGIGGIGANNTAVAGANGGTSSFSGPATITLGTLTAGGGTGGAGATANNNNNGHHIGQNGIGGIGGTGSNGATNYTGGNGSEGSHSASCADISGAGGGGAGTNGNGSNAQQIGGCPHTAAMTGGAGGAQNGGNGGNGIKNNIANKHNQNGNNGSSYGGGGGGAGIHLNTWANQWVLANGGNGGNGAVIIEYTINGTIPSQPTVTGLTTIPCNTTSGTYEVTNPVAGETYTWTYSGTANPTTGTGTTFDLNNITSSGTLTVTPSNNCGDGTPQTITITLETSTITLNPIQGNTLLPCTGGTENYSVNSIPGVTYTWSFSGTGTITGSGNSITLNATSAGTLTVTPSNNCGNGTPQTINITLDNTTIAISPIQGNTLLPCTGGTETYSVNAITGVTYTWSFSGTGTITGSGNSITLNATSAGTLTVTPSNNCGNGTPQTINITLDNTTIAINPIQGNTLLPCTGGTENYSVNSIPGVTYTWSFSGTGTITGSGNSITLNATSAGTLTVTPSNNCGNGTPQTINITLDNNPFTLNPIQGNTLIPCGGAAGTYSVNAITGVTYTWTFSGTGTITGTGNSITLNATTNGVLTVTASDQCGNVETQVLTINLDAPNAVQPDFNLAPSVCQNSTIIQLVGTPAGGQFSVNGQNSSTIDPSVLPTGTYIVQYVVTENSCTLSKDKTIIIHPNPQLSSDLAAEYCFNHSDVTLNFQPPNGILTGDYLNGTTLQASQATSGIHSIQYNYTDANNCSASLTQTYVIGNPIEFSVNYTQNCLNEVTFTNQSNGNYTYYWDFQSIGTSTQKDPTFNFPAYQQYPYTLTVKDANGCSITLQDNISITDDIDPTFLEIPNVITPNKDGVNDFFEIDGSIYNCIDLRITILNRWGNIVYELDEHNLKFEGFSSNKSELAEGVYFYIVNSEKLNCKNGIGKSNCSGFISIIR